MKDSFFRQMMVSLRRTEFGNKKAVPDWQRVCRTLLADQIDRETAIDRHYTGPQILIDRTDLSERDWSSERNACLSLYQQVIGEKTKLLIGDEQFCLIGYEVPNQYNAKGRRADLLAVNKMGGLVVFEGKLANNSDGPFMAVLEGLDYLVALLHTTNFLVLQHELKSRAGKEEDTAESTLLDRNAMHEVIVLAPPGYYYDAHTDDRIQDKDWSFLNNCQLQSELKVRIRFAETEYCKDKGFHAVKCKWVGAE